MTYLHNWHLCGGAVSTSVRRAPILRDVPIECGPSHPDADTLKRSTPTPAVDKMLAHISDCISQKKPFVIMDERAVAEYNRHTHYYATADGVNYHGVEMQMMANAVHAEAQRVAASPVPQPLGNGELLPADVVSRYGLECVRVFVEGTDVTAFFHVSGGMSWRHEFTIAPGSPLTADVVCRAIHMRPNWQHTAECNCQDCWPT